MNLESKKFLFFFLLFFSVQLLTAQTWDGGGDGTSWDDPLNWDNDMVPAAGDLVVFGTDVTVTGTAPNIPSRVDVQSNNTVTLDMNLSVGDGIIDAHCLKVQGNATLNLASGRTFTLTPGFNRFAILHNAGGNSATVNILPGATVDVQQGNRGVSITGTGGNILNNSGTLNLSNNSTTIYNETGEVNNLPGGIINSNSPNSNGVHLDGGMLYNRGTINATIAAGAASSNHGIQVGSGSMMENMGLISVSGGNAARRILVDGMAANSACGIIDVTDGRFRVGDGTFVNNGLFRTMWSGAGIFISGTGTTTNNAFFNNPNNNTFAAGGPFTDNGVSVNDPADMTVNAANSCSLNLPIMAAYGWFDDVGNTNPVGSNTMDGALSFDNGVFAAAGTQNIFTCFGSEVEFTVENVNGPCILSACDLVINEVDYDQPGFPDVAEFIEIYNPCSSAFDLDGYRVRLFNGANGGNYQNIDLPAVSLAAGDYFVICNDGTTVPNCDFVAINSLQNGSPDVLVLENDGTQVDGLSYEGDNGNTAPYVEGTGTSDEDNNSDEAVGLARFPDGNDTDNNDADFKLRCITPGEANVSAATDCLPCMISDISVTNISACDDNGTPDPSDDFFTAEVTITFSDKPSNGNLDMSGDGTASVSVVGLTSPHTFTGVQMSADGSDISLTATFSTFSTCTLTNPTSGTAPSACSIAPCDISDISVANISACDDNGTSDLADDFFTADVTVTFESAPASGTLDLTGDGSASVSVTGLTSPHVFTGVQMSADGSDISLTATFSDDTGCTLENTNAGTAPMACSIAPCDISDISVANISACDDNGTSDLADDFFTADVTVTFESAPASGTLDLTGDGSASVSVTGLTSPHVFTGVQMSADGSDISLTATFSDDTGCTLQNTNAGTAPMACSIAPCDISDISVANISACDDNGTSDLADDFFTADVTVTFESAPASGTLDLTGDGSASVSVTGLTSPHVFTGVQMSADGSDISLTATFSDDTGCTLQNTNAGTAPMACSIAPCDISDISVANISACDDNGTPLPGDDFITVDVTVTFANPPATGTLDLSVGGMASVDVSQLDGPTSHTFTGVEMTADGGVINFEASFSDDADCNYYEGEIAGKPEPCSCGPIINEVDYSQPGNDNAEFIEIYNPCTTTVNLDQYELALVNGATNNNYQTIDLPNVDLAPGAYYVVCSNDNPAAYCDLQAINSFQNGAPDAVSLRFGGVQVDGLSYEGDVPDVVEGSGTGLEDLDSEEAVGLSRFPNGADTDQNNVDFSLRCITPGMANDNASASGCLNCGITAITVSNISACQGFGTGDPTDDIFTADVTVTFADRPNTGLLVLSGDGSATVNANGLTSPHTFTGVEMTADGSAISLTATFNNLPTCTLTETNAGMAPASCSDCDITEIVLSNVSTCTDNGTVDPSDDTFTANVTVNYVNPPSPGTLVLSGDASASVSVGPGSTSHTLGGVVFSADGGVISLTANFQEESGCSFTDTDLGTAPASCSPCDISGISLSDVSSCNDNGTANPADDFFTADVTVFFQNPPADGNLELSGSGLGVVSVSGLGNSYTFEDVMMAADGGVLSFTAQFSDNPTCSFTNFEAGIAPSSCSPCGIESITLSNVSACENQATTDPDDDTFTANVTVTYFQAPTSGTLDLSGDATASTSTFGANSAIFTDVEFSSNGLAINLTASFSANPACSLSANVGTAPPPCSDDCFIVITDVIVENESCPGYGNGTVTIVVNTIPGAQVGYSVDGGATFQLTNHFENLSPGAYPVYVQVFGQNDCSATGMATVLPAPASALQTWYQDWDDDSHSNGVTIEACEQPTGFKLPAALLSLAGDCDDSDPLAIPGQTWWKDSDGDGHSDGTSLTQCLRPTGYETASELTATSGDCDDDNPTTYPGAPEICNGVDDDCDGEVDEGASGGLTWVGNVNFTTQAQVNAWSNCYSIIDGNLTIQNSVITDLSNLSALVEVTGDVYIKSTGLTNLNGLEGLTTIGGYLRIQSNSGLNTLDGLENVTSIGSYLRVYYNPNLTDCCAIHDLLNNGGVGGSITIRRNETGCDSVSEINSDCGGGNNLIAPPTSGISISENAAEVQSINVFPNPTSGELNIRLAKDFESAQIQLFDLQGRLVYQSKLGGGTPSAKIETGHLTEGMFLLHALVDGESFTERIVVE